MNTQSLTAFHVAAKTPLARLANGVRWFEHMAASAGSKGDAKAFNAKATALRDVVSAVFAHRAIAGGYDEA